MEVEIDKSNAMINNGYHRLPPD